MFDVKKLIHRNRLFTSLIFAGSALLWPSANALAAANLVTSSSFVSADGGRTNTYMDAAGTWNGSNEVTNGTGDTFFLTIDNQAAGPVIDDSAFDLAIDIGVASGFRLPSSPFVVTVNESPAFPLCPVIAGVTATQPGGTGTGITLNLPADSDIQPGCSYSFILGLTTDDVSPFVADGFYDVDFDITYNVVDNDSSTAQTQTQTENVEVRTGEVALLKTAVTPIAGDGDLVEFTVSILNAGDGGVFSVDLTDTLSPDLINLRIVPLGSPPTAPPLGNPLTIPYIEESAFAEYTVYADVAVNPAAATCPDLTNSAYVEDRTSSNSTFFDSVPFDLKNPFIDYTPPNINVPFGAAGIDVTIPVINTGTGVAKNISISAPNLGNYTIVVRPTTPNWTYAGAGVFNFTGTISAAATENIDINVSATSCPPPANEDIVWTPAYQNACGTDFFPPIRYSTIAMSNTPDVTMTKTGSSGALNIGQTGTYTIALGGTNVVNLPNGNFVVTDTLPIGVTNATINTIPGATTVLVGGLPYTAGTPIADGATITWQGTQADLIPLPSLVVNYTAGASGVCPVGQTITNTATLDYAACGINNTDSAGFILSESPAGGAITNIAVGGDGNFETGTSDTDGVPRNEPREGEQIPFTVSYSFPAGFPGTWSGTSYNAELRSLAGAGVPLVLTNNGNDVHLRVSRISDGVVICDLDLNPATDFSGGDGSGALVITDFAAITGCPALIPLGMQDHDMVLTYAATSPEGGPGAGDPANDDNVGGYLENTTLTVAGGPLSCLGTTEFIQAINVNIERAVLDLSATFNNGNPISVCEVVPARLNIAGPAADTSSDNILLQFNDANFEFVDAAGNPGNETTDLAYAGSMTPLAMSGSRVANNVFMTPALNTTTVTADGTVNFNVRLRDSALPQTMAARLDYDSKHTSPDGSATDVDRDYSVAINASPFAVLSGDLRMEFFPPAIILLDSTAYNFRIQVENVGTGTAVNAVYRMTMPAGMRFDSAVSTAPSVLVTPGPYDFTGQTIEWDLGDMPAGSFIDIDISASIDQTTCFQGPGEEINSLNEWGCGIPITNSAPQPPLVLAPTQLTLRHDQNNSFCELCNEGEVRLLASNTGGVLLTSVNVTENLMASGLTYVAGSTTYRVDGAAAVPAVVDPVPFGASGEYITWTPTNIPELANLYSAFNMAANTPQEVEIIFRVRRNTALPGINEEDLVSAIRNIEATATYGLFCDQFSATPVVLNATSGIFELPLEQPAPQIILQGRNVDANQSAAQYTDDVFGGAQDDVIWRLTVNNNSAQARADLEDLLVNSLFSFISETISPPLDIDPNYNITEVCNSEANATLAANGASPGAPDCLTPGSLKIPGIATATAHDVDDPFGTPDNDELLGAFVDTLESGQAQIYFVGKFQTLCNLTSANVDIEWGCEADAPAGGISDLIPPGNNVPPGVVVSDSQISGSDVSAGGIAVSHTITGTNPTQPLGSKGILTINITNNANGSVRGVTLTDILPAGYALDISQVANPGVSDELLAAVVTTPLFGVYPGMVDTATVTNLDSATFENNTTLDISLTSSGGVAPQNNLLRVGDSVTLTIKIIKISGFDIEADPDVEDETAANGKDPAVVSPLLNQLDVNIFNTCGEFVGTVSPANLAVLPSPEDLDITINRGDPNKTYVISNPADTLTLDVEVTNAGGHDANNHFIMVTIGSGLQVNAFPVGTCVAVSPPASARPVWIPGLPAAGQTYTCDAGSTIRPNNSDIRHYVFTVQKNGAGADLTFRADVVGEITLANSGAGLDYPTPVTNVITNVANNYSLDSIRARIIGFNLTKTVTDCREQGPLPADSRTASVQIGEDCTYRLSAGWFGFSAPGFGQISIGNIAIFDDITLPLPATGQGFISQNAVVSGTAAGSVVFNSFATTPPLVAPDEITQGQWNYNTGANNITDNFNIDIDIVKRTRNDALNSSAPPNNHSSQTTDVLNVSFQVDFDGAGGQPPVTFTNGSANYPPLAERQVDISIAEPNLVLSKQVCNEDVGGVGAAGIGAACSPFLDTVQGDVNDTYTYRIQITNTAVVGIASKPAFDVVVVDTLDLFSEVLDPATDGIDNDGDGNPGGIRGGTAPTVAPARTMTFNSATTAALVQIDPGVTVNLYYRVDPDDTAVPGQQLINNVVVDYDSLAGASGSQDAPIGATGTAAGARSYQLTDSATIDLLVPVAGSDSKSITRTTLTNLGDTTLCTPEAGNTKCTGIGPAANNIQNVSIGEEVLFQLSAGLPAATYYNLVIRDTLPAGLDCIQVPAVGLSADFSPQTEPTITCTGSDVTWDFGTRTVTALPFAPLDVTFIARVENLATLNAADVLTNGGLSTVAQLEFTDLLNNPQPPVVLGPATLTIAEPLLTVNQSFAVANADAGDILTVTVTVTNDVTATAPAYNLQVLNDLQATGLTFQNVTTSVGQQPDAVNTGGSGNEPLFSWNAANPIFPIQPGDSVTFTYTVAVDNAVQPLDSLSNTVDIRWTSLPSNNTVLNTLPSATDMREGSVPPLGLPADDYEASFTNNAISVPGALITKVDNNPLEVFTIGASKRFTVTVQLPDGAVPAPGLNISDILNSTGTSYIYDDTAINYTINNIASINGVPGGNETNFTALPVNGAAGTLNWVTGAIVTDVNDDIGTPVVTPEIIIEYNARVNNDATTGIDVAEINTLTNIANLDFVSGTDGPVSAGTFNVLEPVLTSTRTFSNITSPGNLPDGGDTIEYVVTILNTGASEAFDLTIVDTLPAELSLDPGFTPTVSIAGAPAFNVTPDNAPAGPLVWGQAQTVPNGLLDIPAGLPVGQGLVLTYRVVLDDIVEPNLNINNNVFIDWTSQNGVTALERNGIGCPAFVAPNDYCVESTGLPLTVIDANAVSKVITADTYVAPLGTVRVGDTVTFQLQIDIQEGRTRNISLSDAMPVGMTFVDVVSVNGVAGPAPFSPPAGGAGSNFSYAPIPAANLPLANAVGTTTFNIGTVTNDPAGDATTDTFIIEYRARVTENAGIPHVVSTPLTNSVTLAYIDAVGAPPAADPRLTSTATTTVLQPLINTLTKLDRRGAPFVTGVTVDPSADVMQFQLQACNAVGGAPAYSLQITDDLPVQINEATITGPVNGLGNPDVIINGGPALAVDGIDYVYTAPIVRGGNMLFVFTTPLNSGQCIDINFDAAFYNDFAVNMTWDNSVGVDEYWSLPLASGQQYPAVGPAVFSMNNTAGIEAPVKVLQSPVSAEATIGEEIIYRITVPGAPMPGALHNVIITDTLDPSLIFVSATDVSGNGFVINNNTIMPGAVSLQTDLIPTGQQAVIELRARVDNVVAASAGTSFDNTTSYTFANLAGGPSIIAGGSDTTANPLTIVEPVVVLNKVVANLTKPGLPPDAGDILQYTLTFTASGGGVADNFSDAFDVSINDSLSLGMVFNGGLTVSGAGNSIAAPVINPGADGITIAQNLSWSLASGNADIDIAEGTFVIMTYQVRVLDEALAQQSLTNSAVIQWTGIDGVNPDERDGSGVPAVNDYFTAPAATSTTTSDNNTVVKTRLSDTFDAADNIVRIGDIVDYELRLTIQEGTSPANVIVDTLPRGLQFEEVVSINGIAAAPYTAVAPFTHSNILNTAIVTAGNPATGPTTVTWTLGDVVNVADNNAANDEFVIVYRARVLNLVHPQVNNINLLNTVNYDYTTAPGPAVTESDNQTIVLLQPNLAVTKTAVPAGGVTVTDPANTIIEADEVITYTIDIVNSGTAPAYDVVLNDVIPVGLRNGALTITVDSVELLIGGPLLPVNPVYTAATGVAVWDFDNGVADAYSIPVGDTLRIVYRVQADPGLGAGLTLINAANVSLYYSFDDDAVPLVGAVTGVREIYGPTNTATVTLTTTNPNPPLQISPALTATIGQPFTYRIRIPDVAMATALHDVRILEDLSVSSLDIVDLNFVSAARVSGTQPWDVINVGNLISVALQDLAAGVGIEVPPSETIEVDMTVVLRDQLLNTAGKMFNNTVSYTFNGVDGDVTTVASGGADTSADIRILEPLDMVLTMGPAPGPVQMTFGTPTTFFIDVENSTATNANASDAFDLTITNVLPDQPDAGLCDTPPANFSAEIRDAGGVTVRALVENTDYVTSFTGVPSCTLSITMQSVAGRIEPDNHLYVTYDASLDVDSVDAVLVNNIAAATQWFSADTPAGVKVDEIREYNATLSNGTSGVDDEQDVITVEVLGPVLVIEKEVFNVTSGAVAVPNVILQAEAGDRLRYTITVSNTGRGAIADFSVTDEPDRLTTPPGLFLPGSMSNIVLPVGLPSGPASDFTNINAGANAAGILDIRTLSLTEATGAVNSLSIVFEMVVQPVVENGLVISNQAELISANFSNIPSDDPNFPGLVDPTQTTIGSAPVFVTKKTSADLTGNTSVLAVGDTLRYTLLAQNVGAENSINTVLRDQIPANTRYVANSTTLNGVAVADASAGVSPLQTGLTINAPENATAGFMRADSAATTNIATVTFDVVVASNIINGTIISNQSFIQGTGTSGTPYPDQPSDDPDTDLVNDPTIDVLGNLPILKIQKTATFVPGPTGDINDDGVVDNGERLRYTFNISNTGSSQATNVLLSDAVPVNSSYNANTVVVNAVPLADTVLGTSPLIAGINISSTPAPAFTQVGVIEPGQTATVTFDVTVSGAPGQLITNQATLDSNELPQKLSDMDGNDENGEQPTVVVIGNTQQLSITKEVSVVGGGVVTAGGQLEYVITVRNIGSQPVSDIVISDTLAAQLTLLSGSLTMNGLATGITVLGQDITANYATTYGDLDAGQFISLRFVATVDASQAVGTTISNTARVDWNGATQSASDSASIDIGAAPGVASVNGVIWWDPNFNDNLDTGETVLADWSVDIYLQGLLLDTVSSDQNGVFQANGLLPSTTSGAEYELRYRAPGAGATTASLGITSSVFTNNLQRISDIVVAGGSFNQALNLPIDPNGIVYDSVLRTPVAGVQLTMINQTRSNQPVPASCFDDPNHQAQLTLVDGFYKFDLNFSDPARCAVGDEYEIQVQPPSDGYVGTTSVIIPPVVAVTGNAQDVASCPGTAADKVPTTTQNCENSVSAIQPPTSVAPRTAGTDYYLKFLFNNVPDTDQIFNNHIPVDPELDAAIAISKVAGLLNVTRSQLVPYTITLTNLIAAPLQDLNVIDDFPAGFKYVAGSTRIDGVAVEPVLNGNQMIWQNLSVNSNESVVIKMLLVVGSGVGEGEYVNTARVINALTNEAASGVASATVRVIPDPTFDCSDIIGKVYDDKNLNAYQDDGEKGLAGVQVATARGLRVTTDDHGRFHITCAVVPNEVRGSNFIMKLDDRTLPSGYRVTSENPRVERATRGKMLKFNFGAALHRVVRLDLADGVFEKGATELRPQWRSRIDLLLIELQKDPSILRLSYLGENETEGEVDDRLDAIEELISKRWAQIDCCYKLMIETEVFWRKGKPSDRKKFD